VEYVINILTRTICKEGEDLYEKVLLRQNRFKNYIITIIVILLLFMGTVYFITSSVSKHIMDNMMDESRRLADSYMNRLSQNAMASKIIDDLLEEKLLTANKVTLQSRDKVNNEFLEELAQILNVDEIYWYNQSGKIIYANRKEYLGWQASEGHPVYDFMEDEDDIYIGPIREDTESGIHFKYSYAKARDGQFIQIGIAAETIHQLTKTFYHQRLIDKIKEQDDILDIFFLDNDGQVILAGENGYGLTYKPSKQVKDAIKRDEIYYIRDKYRGSDAYKGFLPIYVDENKIGTLAIIYSLEASNDLIKKVSGLVILFLGLVFAVSGGLLINIMRKNKRIEKLAYYDPITDSLNRNYFMAFFNYKLSQDTDKKRALMIINNTNLRLVRSIYGYQASNELFRKKVKQLRKLDIPHNHLFRFSEGDFFLYVEGYKDKEDLEKLSEQILNLFGEISKSVLSSRFITVKVGILKLDERYKDVDHLIKDAEILIGQLRKLEDKKYCFFDETMQARAILDEKIVEELRKAEYKGFDKEFYLEYQPLLDLKTNKVVGLEALARWKNKNLGFVSPKKFIEIAERQQLIVPLGEWILRTACSFLKEIENKGFDKIKMAVNISVIQLLQEDFSEKLMEIIEDTGVKTSNLELEITESNLMINYSIVNRVLDQLREEGISISLDDFGTGYSSLYRLRKLNIHVIKIDKSFIDNIDRADQKDVFIESIITLAEQLDLKVVAEGVETQEQKKYLEKINCDIMQGYLFSKPVSNTEALRLLKERSKVN